MTIRRLVVFALLTYALLPSAVARGDESASPRRGEVVLKEDFELPEGLSKWPSRSGTVTIAQGYESRRAACVESTNPAAGAHIEISLPARRLRGCKLLLSARVRAENVSEPPQPWNGIKFMTPILTESGSRVWPQAKFDERSFDWRAVAWQSHVPKDAETLSLRLGLERVSGKVWFDEIRVTVRRPPRRPSPERSTGPRHRGHELPRLRGAMVSRKATAEDLRVLAKEWGANPVRWQLLGFKPRIDTGNLEVYNASLEKDLSHLDAALPVCEEVGLKVIVDLHTGPGHWAKPGRSLFTNAACQDRFVEIWEQMARRYKNAPAIWAYDLLNEPLEEGTAEGVADWQELAERTAQAIRRIDPQRTIIVEPAPWGGPSALEYLQPLPVKNVVYSVHMYIPHPFTHQGVYDRKGKPLRYPGQVGGKHWDKAALEKALQPVIEFQKAHNVHVLIGEFSAIRWAPEGSACRYLRDCIAIFEKYEWDWAYHAFREWSGWSVEHGSNRDDHSVARAPTARKKLLLEWFAKNQKPVRGNAR